VLREDLPRCQGSYPDEYAVCPQDGTPLQHVGCWAEGSVIRGKYRILGKVGQGGMGAVYKALHLAFDELRALKVIAPGLLHDQLFVERFKHEAVITRKLQHPNAVRVDDIDEAEDGRPFIVMEFIQGKSLKKLIQEEAPLPVSRVCSITKQVASALDAAHRLGMVHRDIKPDNIALIESPEGELVKVLDFGIAKVKEARLGATSGGTLTSTGVVIGTPQYMSPEQAKGKRGDELDGRSDLYSLGVVMYEMLTAALPFNADTTMEMLLAHIEQPPRPIRTLRPELHESIASLTMRLLEKDPARRPASAKALIEELEAAEKGIGPLGATRVVQPEVVVSRRESRWGIWVGIAVLLVGLGGGGAYIISRHPSQFSKIPASATPGPGGAASQETPGQPGSHAGSPAATGSSNPGSSSQVGIAPATLAPESPRGTTPEGQRIQRGPVHIAPQNPPSGANVASTGPAASTVDPKKIKAAITLGDFYLKDGNYADAIKAYQEGLNLDPSNPDLLDRMERAKKAKAAEERILH
jgi:serine/threonine-protein kinase